ncbi:polysaccharide pyruvyl transferase family protein [Aminobacter aminovorans]|uniref:polysaccharide pyruvyl transferase family protein n=1 Tax=Aminobacter aminovorans TaxID=83263 RepID=UPI002866690B|nr:polysaccharide pyruvyl transferase family protein [Aminobacter aminovorans]MDR7222775.1 hypothetical protein [Aminobacter aminovorans]
MHYADVSNYGDALFPHLVRWQLGQRIPKSKFDFFGPTHDRCSALNSRRFDRNLPSSSYQAAIMAGGEVIHLGDEGLLAIYEHFGRQSIAKPTDIVFGWSQWRSPFKSWIALGMPPPDQATLDAVAEASKGLDLISVRGTLSAQQAAKAELHCELKVIPDIGWLIPQLAEHDGWALPDTFVSAIRGQPYMVFHALPWWEALNEHGEYVVRTLRDIQATGVRVVLLPITDYCSDHAALSWINERASGEFLLLDPSLPHEERAVILSGSQFFLGQSLHGVITTLACGIPAGAIVPSQGHQKFVEALGDIGLGHLRVETWDQLGELAIHLQKQDMRMILEKAEERRGNLAIHFDALADRIVKSRRRTRLSSLLGNLFRPCNSR